MEKIPEVMSKILDQIQESFGLRTGKIIFTGDKQHPLNAQISGYFYPGRSIKKVISEPKPKPRTRKFITISTTAKSGMLHIINESIMEMLTLIDAMLYINEDTPTIIDNFDQLIIVHPDVWHYRFGFSLLEYMFFCYKEKHGLADILSRSGDFKVNFVPYNKVFTDFARLSNSSGNRSRFDENIANICFEIGKLANEIKDTILNSIKEHINNLFKDELRSEILKINESLIVEIATIIANYLMSLNFSFFQYAMNNTKITTTSSIKMSEFVYSCTYAKYGGILVPDDFNFYLRKYIGSSKESDDD